MHNAPLKAAVALLALLPGVVRAAEITQYTTRLDVTSEGTGRAVSTLVVTGAPAETLEIPLGPGWSNLRVEEAPAGLVFEAPKTAKATTARATLPPAAAPTAATRFTFAFDVPEAFAKAEDTAAGAKLTIPRESRTLKFAFVNTQAALIKSFGLLVVLPEEYRFQAIREQLPKLKKTEVEPRARLGATDGRQNAFLQVANLKQGDATSMQLEALPKHRSPFWLLAGLALSALYLVSFRDLVSRTPESTQTR